jgi:uncharacterized protein YllA (UPF0747 family)
VSLDFEHFSPEAVQAAVREAFGAEVMSALSAWSAEMRRAGYPCSPGWRQGEGREGDNLPEEILPALLTVLLLPAVAAVADPSEVVRWSAVAALCRRARRDPPRIWPRASFTAVDSRSRKLAARYDIPLDLLYGDAPALVRRALPERGSCEVSAAFSRLQEAVDAQARTLRGFLGAEAAGAAGVDRRVARIQYQLETLAQRSQEHWRRRAEILNQLFQRLCERLAPEGHRQEERLAALQILAEGSDLALERLYQSVDITLWQHQFLDLD